MTIEPLTVTLDTNQIIDASTLDRLLDLHGSAIEFTIVTVTVRELNPGKRLTDLSEFDQRITDLGIRTIPESMMLGESQTGFMALAADGDNERLRETLDLASNGGFPPPGEWTSLTDGQERQKRDALILASHSREGHDVLVTGDRRFFINHGRRGRLERIWETRIMTPEEFLAQYSSWT
ncbi:MAG: hypothetical protein KJ698_04275 [Actinobacteria bacterium]|nr:hypothetical protein [Actinomycetota bacterium]MBU1493495.1 hypothetical protein [Actinomycetota bacterium]MBU1865484.1 hypothetical protein [Actinomycetota bacterium]